MTTQENWNWLTGYADILEAQLDKAEKENDNHRIIQIRLAERTLNTQIDIFSHLVDEQESMPVTVWLDEHVSGGKALWNQLKDRRDAIADRAATYLEAHPDTLERYQAYCENLKGVRTLGATL